ncbi:hypothetical protein V2J09_020858, partial [Rumex salicifolius]
ASSISKLAAFPSDPLGSTISVPASVVVSSLSLSESSTISSNPSQHFGAVPESQTRSVPKSTANFSLFSFFPSSANNNNQSREKAKEELLQAIAPLDHGAKASLQDQALVDKIARKLEAMNQVKEPLKSSLLNRKWELFYTTSQAILQLQRPPFLRPFGKIYQAINVDTLRAQNMETWPFFNQITANLVPINSRRVAIKFDYFKIGGLLRIKNPGSGRGQLEIKYLGEGLSCFGSKGPENTVMYRHIQVNK